MQVWLKWNLEIVLFYKILQKRACKCSIALAPGYWIPLFLLLLLSDGDINIEDISRWTLWTDEIALSQIEICLSKFAVIKLNFINNVEDGNTLLIG